MTVDLEAAVSFAATHARILDRHRLRLVLDPDDSAAAASARAALSAYRNPDGGYGWGLEPDLRSTESQTAAGLHAFEVWAEVGSAGPEARQLCDWLTSVSLADGGVPFALPLTDPVGSAPFFAGADHTISSLQITAAVAANAHRVAAFDPGVAAHPWLRDATQYCFDAIGALDGQSHAYVLAFSLRFLDAAAATTPEAPALIERLLASLPPSGVLPVEGGAEGEVLRPLDYAPDPATAVRMLLPASPIEEDLRRLAGLQQSDGGWPVDWVSSSPAATLEWRGYVTVRAVGQLIRNGLHAQ